MMNSQRTDILGVTVDITTTEQVVEAIQTAVRSDSFLHIVTPNPEMVLLAQNQPQFIQVLNHADVHIPDGIGLQVGAEILSAKIPNRPIFREISLLFVVFKALIKALVSPHRLGPIHSRVTGVDVCLSIFNDPPRKNFKVFLLGGDEGVAEQAKVVIKQNCPLISVVGARSGGEISLDGNGSEDLDILEDIQKLDPDFLIVCFGAPRQDLWIAHNRVTLGGLVAIGAGGTLDFIVGKQQRAPRFVRRIGLEWLWRVVKEPRRIGRILNAIIVFPAFVIRRKHSMVQSGHGASDQSITPR